MRATLRVIRENRNMSVEEAAKKIGIPPNRLIGFEEHRNVPGIPTILKIVEAYKLNSYDDILFNSRNEIIRMHQSWPRNKY